MRPVVYMLCGLPGSGKTTYARTIETADTERLSIDEYIFDKHGQYGVDYPESEYRQLYRPAVDNMKVHLGALVRGGRTVILDFGFWTESQRNEFKAIIETNGGTWRLLYFKTDKETLLKRLQERNQRVDANALRVEKEALTDFIEQFEEPVGEGEEILANND